MGRLKVLFITAWYPTKEQPVGGVFVREHAKAVRLYDDVIVLHCGGQSPDVKGLWRVEEDTDESLTEGIPTYRVWHRRSPIPKTSFFIYLWSALGAFRQIMAEGFHPDIIHAHVYTAGLPAVLIGKLYHLPVVITEGYSAFPRRLLSTVEVLKARFAFQWSELVLPVSSALQTAIQDYGIRAQFRVVPRAVDPAVFFPRANSNRDEKPRRLLFVGLLVPVKGVPYLLQALAILHRRRDDWHLDIVGDGPERANYEQLVAQLGLADSVTFHGLKSKREVAEFMRQADLFVLASVWDSLPSVLLEAMASGLPIVATAVGGIPEIVDEDSGILAKAIDPNDLCQRMEAALRNLEQFDREALAKKALSKYSLQHVGCVLHELYGVARHGID